MICLTVPDLARLALAVSRSAEELRRFYGRRFGIPPRQIDPAANRIAIMTPLTYLEAKELLDRHFGNEAAALDAYCSLGGAAFHPLLDHRRQDSR